MFPLFPSWRGRSISEAADQIETLEADIAAATSEAARYLGWSGDRFLEASGSSGDSRVVLYIGAVFFVMAAYVATICLGL